MPTLAETGIDKKLSSRAQRLAVVCLGSPRIHRTAPPLPGAPAAVKAAERALRIRYGAGGMGGNTVVASAGNESAEVVPLRKEDA